MSTPSEHESQTAYEPTVYEPVVLVRLRDAGGLTPLLDVRATALRVTSGGDAPLEFVLDDIPTRAHALAARLTAQLWCAGAWAYPAIAVWPREPVSGREASVLRRAVRSVDVRDPAVGPLKYFLLPGSADGDGPAR